jgi:drug/metabolite transporter (DMT)-like permease
MQSEVFYTVIATAVLVANDLIFRKETRGASDTVRFYMLTTFASGLVAIALKLATQADTISRKDLLFGVISGVISFAAYLCMLTGMRQSGNPLVGIVIFRLNLVPAYLLGVAFTGEVLSLKRLLGVAACTAALLFFTMLDRKSMVHIGGKALILCVGSCLLAALLNLLNKLAMSAGCSAVNMAAIRFMVAMPLSLILLFWAKPKIPPRREALRALASGALLVLAIILVSYALKTGEIGFVIPITQLSFVLTAIISVVVCGEKLLPRQILGIVCAAASILLIV